MVNHILICEFNKCDVDEKPLYCKRCQTKILDFKDHDCFINYQNKIIKEFENKLNLLENKLLVKIGYNEDKLNQIENNYSKLQDIQIQNCDNKFNQFEEKIKQYSVYSDLNINNFNLKIEKKLEEITKNNDFIN